MILHDMVQPIQQVRASSLGSDSLAEESLDIGGLRLEEVPVDPLSELPGVNRGATVLAPLERGNLSTRDSRREGKG